MEIFSGDAHLTLDVKSFGAKTHAGVDIAGSHNWILDLRDNAAVSVLMRYIVSNNVRYVHFGIPSLCFVYVLGPHLHRSTEQPWGFDPYLSQDGKSEERQSFC